MEANQALEKSGAFEKEASAKGEVLYALREEARTEIEQAISNKNYDKEIKLTDSSPVILTSQKGVRDLPMMIKASHARENILTEKEAEELGLSVRSDTHFHGLGKDLFLKVIDGLDGVTRAYRGTQNAEKSERRENYFLLVSQYKDADGNIINVPVYINEGGIYNRVYIDTNKIATVFGRNEFEAYIKRELAKGNLVRIKNRSTQASESAPPIGDNYSKNASTDSISDSSKNVNTKFSDRDSAGRTLSEGQQEYFKDSANRDENGSLKVMYRGDSNEVTVFDRKKTNHSNLYGRGFYFTDNKTHAKQYGEPREFYLDIKNPLSPEQNAITKKQMLNFLKVIENDGEDYDLYNYGQGATAETVLDSVWGKGDFEMLQDVSASAIGDLVAAVELFNQVNGTNYDGIILPSETVTFYSSQAKLTSNLNPTENKDIRYSDRDFSYAELTSKDDLKGIVIDKTQQVKLTSNGSIDAGWVVSEVKKKCEAITTKSKTSTYYTNVPDIGKNVEISNKGITHGFIKSRSDGNKNVSSKAVLNARVSLEIPQILQNSIEVNRSVRSGNIDVPYSHIMMGTVALEDANGNLEYYAVRSVIEERANQDPILTEAEVLGKLYAINAKKVGTPHAKVTKNGVARTRSVAYTYNIAQFLEDVKLKFDDTFSEDVYKNLGMARKENDFSKNLLFSDRDNVSVYDIMGERDRILKENEQFRKEIENLKERVALEKKVTNGTVLKNSQLLAAAAHLRNIANSNMDKVELAKALKEVDSNTPDRLKTDKKPPVFRNFTGGLCYSK